MKKIKELYAVFQQVGQGLSVWFYVLFIMVGLTIGGILHYFGIGYWK